MSLDINQQHTPAPWHYSGPDSEYDSAWIESFDFIIIAEVWPTNSTAANARLIAAAPDLLSVAQEYIRLASNASPQGVNDWTHLYERTNDVIKKATQP